MLLRRASSNRWFSAGLTTLVAWGFIIATTSAGGAAPREAEQQRYDSGIQLFRAGRYEDAVKEFRVALALRSRSARLAYNLARSLERSEQYREAAKYYRRYLVLAPNAEDRRKVLELAMAMDSLADETKADGDENVDGRKMAPIKAEQERPRQTRSPLPEPDPPSNPPPSPPPSSTETVDRTLAWGGAAVALLGMAVALVAYGKSVDGVNGGEAAKVVAMDESRGSAERRSAVADYDEFSEEVAMQRTIGLVGLLAGAAGGGLLFYNLASSTTVAGDLPMFPGEAMVGLRGTWP